MSVVSPAALLTIEFPALPNEQGSAMLWLASWLHEDGSEGAWVYSGRGGESITLEAPAGAGVRIRRWVSDGLPPEYADAPLAADRLSAGALDFDTAGPHSRLNRIQSN